MLAQLEKELREYWERVDEEAVELHQEASKILQQPSQNSFAAVKRQAEDDKVLNNCTVAEA